MTRPAPTGADLHRAIAVARLVGHAVEPLADVVEDVHGRVVRLPRLRAQGPPVRTRGITGMVYRSVRRVARETGRVLRAVGGGRADLTPTHVRRGAALRAVLNGVLGHHLAAASSPLALPMALRRGGTALALDRESLSAAIPDATGRIVVLAHGLCMNDLQWRWRGVDHGEALQRDLGYTPVYLHYNTGLHISSNGRALAGLLEEMVAAWPVPVEHVAVVGHSMGGLVARSACRCAEEEGMTWRGKLRKLVFLATPHHGAPLERGGNRFETALAAAPYAAPLAKLGQVRSAGITDLRHGSLLDEDWHGRDRFHPVGDVRRPVPLPEGVECFTLAATRARHPADRRGRLMGDGMVPLASALGEHADAARALTFAPERRWVAYGTGHLDVLGHPEVYERIRGWLAS